jgi:carbonic anhydrase
MSEASRKGHLPMPPSRRVAVVACMDARLDPARVLGLEEGDAHVVRNAGGRAADAVRSLVISQQRLLLKGVPITGFVYDVKTGRLREVA